MDETRKGAEVYNWEADQWVDTNQQPDWAAVTMPDPHRAQVVPQQTTAVNPVNGHGRGCACPQCPGWQPAREARPVEPRPGSTAPPAREPRPLVDQVIPAACLMAMVTVCALILLPVITPLLTALMMSMVAIIGGVVALAVVVVVLASVSRRHGKETPGAGGESLPRVIRSRVIGR